jgi:hypothetical protein
MFSITGTAKRVAFTEVYSKQKKIVPAPNAYKYDVGTIYNRLSCSPMAIRIKRHWIIFINIIINIPKFKNLFSFYKIKNIFKIF